LESLKFFIGSNNEACFLEVLERAHFSSLEEKQDLSAWLRQSVLDTQVQQELSDYARLKVLNFVIPVELWQRHDVDHESDRFFLGEKVNSNNVAEQAMALTVLGYFRDDRDIRVLRAAAHSEYEEIMVSAIVALADNCSPAAREALRDVLKRENVQEYLEIGRGKQSINELINNTCPLPEPDNT
jgi:hypothetical protein